MSEFEKTIAYLKETFFRNQVIIFWISLAAFLFYIASEVKEITTLLIASYVIALVLDPLIIRLEKYKVRRGFAVIALGVLSFLLFLFLLLAGLPSLIKEFEELGSQFPSYLKVAIEHVSLKIESYFGISIPSSVSDFPEAVKGYLSTIGSEQFTALRKAGSKTLLKGYSIALTLVNLFLLPFFVFYLTRDLHKFHAHVRSFLSPAFAGKISKVGSEMLSHVHAFLKGQITVCVILAFLYSIGLFCVGLPSAIAIGTLAGLLNIIPYFGLAIGLVLASMLTLSHDPTVLGFVSVYSVFAIVQLLEGSFITPKIVGESVGIHPLLVMVALIIGGQLFGLVGLLIAIPLAASLRVLLGNLLENIE